jgi:chromate transporter
VAARYVRSSIWRLRMTDRPVRVSMAALFLVFLQVSFFGFGGGLAWARRIVVEQRRWANDEEFTDIVSLCQFMPGPNIVGIAVCVGARLRGWTRTVAAVSGFIVIPGVLGFSLGLLYLRYAHLAVLRNMLGGVAAVAAGLLIATGIRMLVPHIRRPRAVIVAMLDFGAMAFTTLPVLVVLLGLALVSITAVKIKSARTP